MTYFWLKIWKITRKNHPIVEVHLIATDIANNPGIKWSNKELCSLCKNRANPIIKIAVSIVFENGFDKVCVVIEFVK